MAVRTHHSAMSISPNFSSTAPVFMADDRYSTHKRIPLISPRTLVQSFEAACKSDMTSIAPLSSKKRAREVEISSPIMRSQQNFDFHCQFQQPNMVVNCPTYTEVVNGVLRCVSPATTSTSGRSDMDDTFISQLRKQCEDIDTIVHLHMEQLRLGLQEASKRHRKDLMSMLQHEAVNRLTKKETEIANASQRNAKLEEEVRQLAVESQLWFDVARKNQDIVCSLKATLDQVTEGFPLMEEGSGESEGVEHQFGQSCCYGEDDVARCQRDRVCKSCGEGKMTVVLLPCSHLCLCEDCESTIDTCPLCHSAKKASVRIVMS